MSALEALWRGAREDTGRFDPDALQHLPEPAQRYLRHAIAPQTTLATAVRLTMKGEIRLGRWRAFEGEEVLHCDRGFVWSARLRMFGLPVSGYDRLVDGVAELRWRLLGAIPLVAGSGEDVRRSAAGRYGAESIWLPSAWCGAAVEWSSDGPSHVRATRTIAGERVSVDLGIDEAGGVRTVALERWGNPGREPFRYHRFGGVVLREATFAGLTLPVELEAGWRFGTARFRDDGVFFRCVVEHAQFR
jgi:hypothetical protein